MLRCARREAHAHAREDCLQLDVSSRFANKWISDQWQRWCSHYATLGMPRSSFAPSLEMQRRAKQRMEAGTGATTAGSSTPVELAFPEYSVVVPALLFLLARWASNLKPEPARLAAAFLRAFLDMALASWSSLVWHVVPNTAEASHTFPDMVGGIAVNIVAQRVFIDPLLTGLSALRRAFQRHEETMGM